MALAWRGYHWRLTGQGAEVVEVCLIGEVRELYIGQGNGGNFI